ncbi:MAG: TIGR00730 family Rossman fold protein [Bacteroidales bacterium]|nr:TIGR00730 family Rossman fold protein [Bacteroidales bacterium]MBO5073784.1 TIGR00730 family Rossman fold protein [Bacteroidales bacterium]MBQ8573236.1 TIGR00730 family Rossman fold protein [Bacteroidales bacterium]MBR1960876.1 TIGR00730 family Rossman fold protein [Bacteroidales bacterium]
MKGKIAVFCSASFEIDPKYNRVAREFVRAASLCGYGIVSGGTVKGTMGEISDELHSCGGYHLGVIPRFMQQYVYPDLTETVWTDTMAERKTLLREGTCAVVALPGGIGTLDEVIETFALVHLKQYFGKIFLLNHDGFYEPLRQLLRHYVDTGMMTEATMSKICFAESKDEILSALQ